MKTLLSLFFFAAPLAHADNLPPDIDRIVVETGTGTVQYRHKCDVDYARAKADGIAEAVQKANIDCGSNVRQLSPLTETNECENFVGGPIKQTATFGCIRRPEGSRNVILSGSYFMSVGFAHDILDNGFNSQGEAAVAKVSAERCGGKFVRVRTILVAAKIDPTQPIDKQMEVVSTTQVYCAVENELLKN